MKRMLAATEGRNAELWRMDYRFAGKPKMLSLGLDPSEERQREKRDAARRGDSDLFRTVATEWRVEQDAHLRAPPALARSVRPLCRS